LFIYGDASASAVNVRQAIYDGPYDLLNYEVQPVILEEVPSLANGLASLEPVPVESGELIVDSWGILTDLAEGTVYLPAGCRSGECAQTFSGSEAVNMDQLVVRFKLRPDLRWSDGAPLTSADSVYSYEVARELFPRVRSELIRHTDDYQAVDETTVEWRAVPGYLDATYQTNFFSPLPQHVWGVVSPAELLSAEIATRSPLGWGPYVIDEWVTGDHIAMSVNPYYFRTGEGLPKFDRLIYRFMPGGTEALNALLAGECDLVDELTISEVPVVELSRLQEEGVLKVISKSGAAWEHAGFGIQPSDPEKLSIFKSKELRQAIAMCIDRAGLAAQLFNDQDQIPDTYVPPTHPLVAPEANRYPYDPRAAGELLESLGWIDTDNDPGTPRLSQGVSGVPDGVPLSFTYQTLDGADRQGIAQILSSSLAQCGIQVELSFTDWDTLFAPGPDGPIFGRQFDMAQFAWSSSLEPPCYLYISDEIPGPYPEYPKGWGGANASGYSNPEFDLACKKARFSLPDMPEHAAAHQQAQVIFAEDLPVIPLYLHVDRLATRMDMCGVILDPSAGSSLWNVEAFDYGPECER
jgi:peptide/nickel transport system substrate-binding protein